MRNLLQIAAVVCLGGSVAFGQAGNEGRGPGGRGGFGAPSNPLFEALDANKDGVISADEIANAVAALKALDTNGDGQITRDEVRPQFTGRGEGGGPGGPGGFPGFGRGGEGGGAPQFTAESFIARLMERDEDKDGKLSATELGERNARLLETYDADGDGHLNADELKAAAEAMVARFREAGGRPGSGRPGEGSGRRGGTGGERPQRPQTEGSDRI